MAGIIAEQVAVGDSNALRSWRVPDKKCQGRGYGVMQASEAVWEGNGPAGGNVYPLGISYLTWNHHTVTNSVMSNEHDLRMAYRARFSADPRRLSSG